MKVIRPSAQHTGLLYSPRNTPGIHLCFGLSQPQGHNATGRIMSMENSNDTIGNRTHNLLAILHSVRSPNTITSGSSCDNTLSVTAPTDEGPGSCSYRVHQPHICFKPATTQTFDTGVKMVSSKMNSETKKYAIFVNVTEHCGHSIEKVFSL